MTYISEISSRFEYKLGEFNIIASGTGTGKTVYVRKHLLDSFPDIKPSEVLYVTSRAMVCDQQAKEDGIARFRNSLGHDESIAGVWNGDSKAIVAEQADQTIWIMNYSQLGKYLDTPMLSDDGGFVFKNIRLVVFDECHSLYVDNHIVNMSVVRCWVRERIWSGQTYVIGLTATPGIMQYYARMSSLRINIINEDAYLVNYKAKHLICAEYRDLLYLLMDERLPGRTMVLVPSVEDGGRVANACPNAFFLCSKSHKAYTSEMEAVRGYIIEHENIPEYLSDADVSIRKGSRWDKKIDVLVTTSTMREGLNIREESGVKNVITCMSDDVHVIQFMGRCRYSIENLVVVDFLFQGDRNKEYREYIRDKREEFAVLMKNQENSESAGRAWFEGIKYYIQGTYEDIDFYSPDNKLQAFWKFVDEQISIGDGAYMLCGTEDKSRFLNTAKRFQILDLPKSKYTFQRVKRVIDDSDDYVIEHKYRYLNNGDAKKNYYYIITRRVQ